MRRHACSTILRAEQARVRAEGTKGDGRSERSRGHRGEYLLGPPVCVQTYGVPANERDGCNSEVPESP